MKIGILGTGYIIDMLSNTIIHMDDALCYAIASRDINKAIAFKKEVWSISSYNHYF